MRVHVHACACVRVCGLYVRHMYLYTHTNNDHMYIRTDRQTADLLSVFLGLNGIHSRARLGLHGDLKLGILAEATGVAQEGILLIIVDCPGEDGGTEGRREGGGREEGGRREGWRERMEGRVEGWRRGGRDGEEDGGTEGRMGGRRRREGEEEINQQPGLSVVKCFKLKTPAVVFNMYKVGT